MMLLKKNKDFRYPGDIKEPDFFNIQGGTKILASSVFYPIFAERLDLNSNS